ncbi:hypothetical protein JT359_04980 [Candidatus Poribacteria bacterium]|nr:hypothetical protein [Candidatus Poribacteria bacterium]
MSIKNLRVLYCIIALLYIVNIFGCGSDENDEEPSNSPPKVDAFIIPKEFSPEEILEFRILAYDDDGDPLSYEWSVSAGKLDETTGTKVKWTAPTDDETVTVTIYISDGIGKSTKRVKRILNTAFIEPPPIEIAFDPTPDPPLISIVPGKGCFGIKLGDPYKKLLEVHGKPDNPPDKIGYFSYQEQKKGLSGFLDGIDLVEDLFLRHPNKAKTAGKNGIKSKLENVEKELGKAQEVDNNAFGGIRHWYWRKGIEFTYDAENKVESIFVFKPIGIAPSANDLPLHHQQQIKKEVFKALQGREFLK